MVKNGRWIAISSNVRNDHRFLLFEFVWVNSDDANAAMPVAPPTNEPMAPSVATLGANGVLSNRPDFVDVGNVMAQQIVNAVAQRCRR